ncbi:MAG: ParB N-terminal domain-containing protein [Mameliella sp.]|nr:ParB N-terminal domain-containing protein [Mameliella sp.]
MDYPSIDPRALSPNPWNSNHVSPEGMERLTESLRRHGWVRPIIVRETDAGYEILGGQHRVEAALVLGHEEVPVYSLGRISDERAKEVGLIDNARYGSDDADELASIIRDIGGKEIAAEFLPFSEAELATLATDIELDDIDDMIDGTDEDHAGSGAETPERKTKTHSVMRFKVSVADEDLVRELIEEVKQEQGFVGDDDLTNAGDALIYIAQQLKEVA